MRIAMLGVKGLPAIGGVVDQRLTDNELFELELVWALAPVE